jgi:mannose-6-phosphate isomerase-like protein (cupin superfamily)
MAISAIGAALIDGGEYAHDGSRRYRVAVSKSMGARDIAQTISIYSPGIAPARRNRIAEEVLYVVQGRGSCVVDGHRYAIEAGTAVFIPPQSVYHVENNTSDELDIVSVCCPEEELTETKVETVEVEPGSTAPIRSVREAAQKAIATGNRTFRLLVNQDLGAKSITQFVGIIPPGRAPMHHHTYEEAIYIIQGHGRLWTDRGDAEFKAGASIYLPRGVSHSLENTGDEDIRLLGVFHPSGSPAVRYDD